jgi:hypothetical protein
MILLAPLAQQGTVVATRALGVERKHRDGRLVGTIDELLGRLLEGGKQAKLNRFPRWSFLSVYFYINLPSTLSIRFWDTPHHGGGALTSTACGTANAAAPQVEARA